MSETLDFFLNFCPVVKKNLKISGNFPNPDFFLTNPKGDLVKKKS